MSTTESDCTYRRVEGEPVEEAFALCPEDDEGNVEYKWRLVDISEDRLLHLTTQMKFRLSEGDGEAFYEIGVADDGEPVGLSDEDMEMSLKTLQRMADSLPAQMKVLKVRRGTHGHVAEVLVRGGVCEAAQDVDEIRVALVGSGGSGKSTLLGVLTQGQLDNGHGLARLNLLRHKHEVESGRTSSITREIIGLDAEGNIINYNSGLNTLSWGDICEQADKVVSFLDLAGHERYMKTTLFGLTAHVPDYVMVTVAANAGVSDSTAEYFRICFALEVPVFVVITKTDCAPAAALKNTITQLAQVIREPRWKRSPMMIAKPEHVKLAADNIKSACPIFLLSNVTGASHDHLRRFFHLLPLRDQTARAGQPTDVLIDGAFTIAGVGTVVSGTVMAGSVKEGDTLLLGPGPTGLFAPVTVGSIEMKRRRVREARAGRAATFALADVPRDSIRKGMRLLHPSLSPRCVRDFDVQIRFLTAEADVSAFERGREVIVHSGTTRAAARVLRFHREGDAAKATLRFCYASEYLTAGAVAIVRACHHKAVGTVRLLEC